MCKTSDPDTSAHLELDECRCALVSEQADVGREGLEFRKGFTAKSSDFRVLLPLSSIVSCYTLGRVDKRAGLSPPPRKRRRLADAGCGLEKPTPRWVQRALFTGDSECALSL